MFTKKGIDDKLEFRKNEMIDSVLSHYYKTFELTLDTVDYVPEKYNEKILKYIYKNLKKKFKEIDVKYCNFNNLTKLNQLQSKELESDPKQEQGKEETKEEKENRDEADEPEETETEWATVIV